MLSMRSSHPHHRAEWFAHSLAGCSVQLSLNLRSRAGCVDWESLHIISVNSPNLHSRAGCVDTASRDFRPSSAPNLHSRAGCVRKHHQNAGCMYGIHIHNLYLAECLDLLWRKTRLRIRHASRLLGVESPMPTVRRPRKHSVHFPFARSVSLMIFSISLVARFKLAL